MKWWLAASTPFITFCLKYFFLYQRHSRELITAPSVVGLSLQQATIKASDQSCSVRIIEKRHEISLPEGTIITQYPTAGTLIRPHEALLLIIAKPVILETVPSFVGMTLQELSTMTSSWNLKIIMVPHQTKTGRCIGQNPGANKQTEQKQIIVYCAEPQKEIVIMPQLLHKRYCEIRNALHEKAEIELSLLNLGSGKCLHKDCECTIKAQYPSSGTFLNLNKKIVIEVLV